MSGPLSSGVPGETPQAARTAGRSHVTRLFSRATDRAGCRERRESDERREAPERTKRVWLKREESPAGRRREVRERLAPNRSHPGCGPGLPDGRGDARRLRTGDGRGGEADARRAPRLDGAPRRPRYEGGSPGRSGRTGRGSPATSTAGSQTPTSRAQTRSYSPSRRLPGDFATWSTSQQRSSSGWEACRSTPSLALSPSPCYPPKPRRA